MVTGIYTEPGRFKAVLELVDRGELTPEDIEQFLAARALAERKRREIYGSAPR